MKVREILSKKGSKVFSIGSDKTLSEAIKLLVDNNIGVLIVFDSEGNTVGILSERDILRAVAGFPANYSERTVKDHMTGKLIVVEPEDEVSYVETVMTENRIRHLPVFENNKIAGLISIGDLVKSQMTSMKAENKYLLDYISGNVM